MVVSCPCSYGRILTLRIQLDTDILVTIGFWPYAYGRILTLRLWADPDLAVMVGFWHSGCGRLVRSWPCSYDRILTLRIQSDLDNFCRIRPSTNWLKNVSKILNGNLLIQINMFFSNRSKEKGFFCDKKIFSLIRKYWLWLCWQFLFNPILFHYQLANISAKSNHMRNLF